MPTDSHVATPEILWPILAGILVVATNAFFVTVEFAIVTVRRGRMEELAEDGNRAAGLIAVMLRDPDRAIAGSQLGITVASILLGIVAEAPLARLLEPALTGLVARLPVLAGLAAAIGGLIVLLLLSFFHMVLGEQTPKTIALRYPVQAALFVARPMAIFARLAAPSVWTVDQSTDLVLRLLGVGGQTGGHGIHTVEELKEVVRETHEEGVLPYSDEAILMRAVEFGGRYVREVMIPRTEMVAVEPSATLREFLQIFKTSRHSRFPVYEGDLDHILGIIAIKDVLSLIADEPDALERRIDQTDLVFPAMIVPESRHIGDLFNDMRREQRQMAIVIDEYGGTAGLVTAEELAEEVMGRLTDEWVKEEPAVESVGKGVYELDAESRVDEVNEALSLDLPVSPDYETLAGFLLFEVRHIPKVGDVIDHEGLRFTVLEMAGPKIERVRVERV